MNITDKDKQSLTLGLLWIERWDWPVCVDGRHPQSG
jgi:hypothetical protein